MRPELQRRFDAIEVQRTHLQSAALDLGDGPLNWSSGPGVWSVRQINEHLVLSDENVGQARDAGAVKSEALMFRVLPRALRRALVLRAFRRGAVLPLPSPAVEPSGDVPLPTLLSRWDASRAETRRVLDSLQRDEARYSHPVLGPLTAAEMLKLARAHTAYHARQMEALQVGAAFPREAEVLKSGWDTLRRMIMGGRYARIQGLDPSIILLLQVMRYACIGGILACLGAALLVCWQDGFTGKWLAVLLSLAFGVCFYGQMCRARRMIKIVRGWRGR